LHQITTQKQAHSMPIPWIINSVFYDGELVTLEMASPTRIDALLMAKKA
jgi:hypothetical protein